MRRILRGLLLGVVIAAVLADGAVVGDEWQRRSAAGSSDSRTPVTMVWTNQHHR